MKDLQHLGWGARELSRITVVLFDECHIWPWSSEAGTPLGPEDLLTSLLPGGICPQASEGFDCEYEAVHISSVYLYRGGCVAKELWEKAERR